MSVWESDMTKVNNLTNLKLSIQIFWTYIVDLYQYKLHNHVLRVFN